MNKNAFLSIGLLATVLLGGTALATETSTTEGEFVASSSAGTTNAIGPELQLDQQRHINNNVIGPHLDGLRLKQQSSTGNTPVSYAGYVNNLTGMSAGELYDSLSDKVSIWGSLNYSEAENDFIATAYKSDTRSGSVGLDYIASEVVSLGAFISYSETDTSSAFNSGSSDTDAFTFGPYVSIMINEMFSIDASAGFTSSDIDNTRTVAGVFSRGSQDGDTKFAAAGINMQKWINSWGIGGRLGYSYSDTDNDAYTDSVGAAFASTDSQLGQVQAGFKISYYTPGMMPFVGVTYMNDVDSDDVTTTVPPRPDNDDDEFSFETGVSFFNDGPLYGGFTGNYSVGRADYDAWGIGVNIGYKF